MLLVWFGGLASAVPAVPSTYNVSAAGLRVMLNTCQFVLLAEVLSWFCHCSITNPVGLLLSAVLLLFPSFPKANAVSVGAVWLKFPTINKEKLLLLVKPVMAPVKASFPSSVMVPR